MRCDMTAALAFRRDFRQNAAEQRVPLTLDAIMVRAAAIALGRSPEVNTEWVEGEGIRWNTGVHIGVALDAGEQGLLVPVLKDAGSRTLLDTAAELDRLIKGALGRKLGLDDYQGATFTISNLSTFGIETFTPLISVPQAAILGMGAIFPTPVFVRGEVVKRQIATLALTTDHRILDGAPSARFLARVRDLLEQPLLLDDKPR